MARDLRAEAILKYGLYATATQIEFTAEDKMHSFVDLFLGRVQSYVDQGADEWVDVNIGASRSQPR